jgi:O-antigen ligase
MYIEMMVGGGLLGGLAFLWLMWRAAGCLVAATRLGARAQLMCAVGVAAAGAAVLIHGTVDSFLSFTPTYVLISLTLGFAVACTCGAETVTDADRI